MITFGTEPCARCNGSGVIETYRHVAGGVCAKCSGTKRQLSRKGRAASRAYEKALTERLGRRVDQIKAGQTIRTHEGRPCRVDRIDIEGSLFWFVNIGANHEGRCGRPPHRIVRLYDPAAEAEVAEQIAARFSGASLTPSPACR